jgi:tripartite-type tricarboxylate transporter receptor subunit TctC
MFKKIFLMLCFFSTVAIAKEAKEYTIVTPNTAGSSTDLVARDIAAAYNKRTGNKLIIQNVGGGYQIPGVLQFKKLPKPGIMMVTTGILVYNPKILSELPYTDSDFDFTGSIAMSPVVWVVRADSPYKSMKDIVNVLPNSSKPFVGFANHPEVVNVKLLGEKYPQVKQKVETIKYKGIPEVLVGLMGDDIDVAVVSVIPTVEEFVKSGKFRILGTTTEQPITLAGQRIPTVKSILNVDQLYGGSFLALSPSFNKEEARQLKQDLMAAVNDPVVKSALISRQQLFSGADDQDMHKFINDYRTKIKDFQF